jgi:hypothetical protein
MMRLMTSGNRNYNLWAAQNFCGCYCYTPYRPYTETELDIKLDFIYDYSGIILIQVSPYRLSSPHLNLNLLIYNLAHILKLQNC